MKRSIGFLLIFVLLISLWGCSLAYGNGSDETVFYYCRIDFTYGTEDGVVAAEKRDITGHAGDLSYLLALYLVGPLDEELTLPFSGTRLLSAEIREDTLFIELSTMGKSITDAQFSLGCACLTMTCLELTEVSQVTITSGERTVTMSRESLLLHDEITSAEILTEETQ